MLLVNEVSKLILGGFVDIYSNVEATISLRPLNLSFILCDIQRSSECMRLLAHTYGGGARSPSQP